MSGSSAPPPPPLGAPPPPPPLGAPPPSASLRLPVGLRRSLPSVVDHVPHEFDEMVLPRQFMQIPGQALYKEAIKTIASLEQQISSARDAIYAMNYEAEKAGIAVRLEPSDPEIINKLKKEYTYWLRSADLRRGQLSAIIQWLKTEIIKSIRKNPNVFYLIIDFQNIFGSLQDIIGKCPKKRDDPDKHSMYMSEIAHILCRIVMDRHNYMDRRPIGIILCVQNHNLNDNPDFYNLIATLNNCIMRTGFNGNIIVIPTHNRGAFDDFIFLTAGDILNKISQVPGITIEQEPYEMLTNDELRDMLGINLQLTHKIGIDEFLLIYYGLDLHPDLQPIKSGIERQNQISKFKRNLNAAPLFERPVPKGKLYSTWRMDPYDLLPHLGPPRSHEIRDRPYNPVASVRPAASSSYAAPFFSHAASSSYAAPFFSHAAPSSYAAPFSSHAASSSYVAPFSSHAASSSYVAPFSSHAASSRHSGSYGSFSGSPASSSRPSPYSRPSAFSRRRGPSIGGSFKSRKSRKRRKINKKNYSQKHKTTIKARRKYSKKHRTYKKQKIS